MIYHGTVYFEPDPASDPLASWDVSVDAESPEQAVEKILAMSWLGVSIDPQEELATI